MNGPAASVRIGSRLAPLFEAWEDVVSVFERGLGPLVDLAIRLWLAQIFFVSGVLKTTNWDVTVFLYTHEHPVPGLDPWTAAIMGTGIEQALVCGDGAGIVEGGGGQAGAHDIDAVQRPRSGDGGAQSRRRAGLRHGRFSA
jgi:hypothetical protein